MSEETTEKKNVLQKLKNSMDDKEEQLAVLSTFVRLGVLVWSGFILTLNYITIPGWQQSKMRGDGTYKSDDEKPMNKKEIQQLLATQSGTYQTIRVETPIKIEGAEIVKTDPITGREIDNQGKLV